MLAVLQGADAPRRRLRRRNPVVNGGFENAALAPWACTGQLRRRPRRRARPHRHRQRLGPQHLRLERPAPDDHRHANRTYTVTAWIRTSANNTDGYFGLRTAGGQVLGEQRFGRLDGYTKLRVTVNTGANTSLVLYAGLWANGDTWFQIDDVSVAVL